MGCKAVKDGESTTPSIICLVENDEQKEYCSSLVNKWENRHTIKYTIKDNQPKFAIKLSVRGRETVIQNAYTNNSEEEMQKTLERAYNILK